jgi:hypothetical protein
LRWAAWVGPAAADRFQLWAGRRADGNRRAGALRQAFPADSQKTAAHPAFRIIPVVSAALIVCIGLLMTGVSLGWIQPNRLAG